MKTLYLLLVVLVFTTTSCFTKTGDPGPTGTVGTTGTTGANTLDKQGTIAGTLEYVDYKDSALSLPFSYQYTESVLSQSTYSIDTTKTSYKIYIERRDPADSEKRFGLTLYGAISNGLFTIPNSGDVDFSYVSLINNNLFEFNDITPEDGTPEETVYFSPDYNTETTCQFSGFNLDTLTGRLTFQYEISYSSDNIDYNDEYDSTTPAIVSGSVDVVLTKLLRPYVPVKVITKYPNPPTEEGPPAEEGLD